MVFLKGDTILYYVGFMNIFTWVDKKVPKVLAYLWINDGIFWNFYRALSYIYRMTQYARRYMKSSIGDVMQQWPGEKNDGNCPFWARNNH